MLSPQPSVTLPKYGRVKGDFKVFQSEELMSNLSISKDYTEQFIQDNAALVGYNAVVLVFPYKATGVTPAASGDDVIDQRMHAP